MNHLLLAELARDAYLEPDAFEEKWQDRFVIRYVSTAAGLECYALHNNVNLIYAFRGTQGVLDILQDLRAIKKAPHVWGRAHQGFYDGVNSGWDRLLEIALNAGDAHVYVTGHSKGAAEAVIFASRLEHQLRSNQHNGIKCHIDEVVTFGSPRCLGLRTAWVYKANLGARTFRYVHCSDPITLVPFTWRYKHAGQLRWWTGKKWKTRTNWIMWLIKSTMALPALKKTGGSHPIKNYVDDQTNHPFTS